MIAYELSAKARILQFTNKMIVRFKPQGYLETVAVKEFLNRLNRLTEEECKELLGLAHNA